MGIGAANDWIIVDDLGGYKTTDNLTGKMCIQIFPALFVIIGALLLAITYFKLESKLAKKRIGYFTLGFLTIIIGLLMYLVDALLEISPYIFPTFAIITWVMGPTMMLIGLNIKVDGDSKVLNREIRDALDPKTLEPKMELEKPT